MGIYCEIHLDKPPGEIYRPGGVVTGIVKYAVDEQARYKSIILCLRGAGKCEWVQGEGDNKKRYFNYEEYVDIQSIIDYKIDDGIMMEPGFYTRVFRLELPLDIPPSYNKSTEDDGNSEINYYVKLKFKRKGIFKFDKTFKTEITVGSLPVNTSLEGPIIYGAQRSLLSFGGKNIIDMKVTINKTILVPGEAAEMNIEVTNDSRSKISAIQTKLLEVTKYIDDCGLVNEESDTVMRIEHLTEPVEEKSTTYLTAAIPMPDSCYTVHHSKIISREYMLRVLVNLPFPHTDLTLNIPVVISHFSVNEEVIPKEYYSATELLSCEQSPSDWEVMQEDETSKRIKSKEMKEDDTDDSSDH